MRKNRQESRRDPRVKEKMAVNWKVKDRAIDGKARVRNISTTGMMVATRIDTLPPNDSVLAIEPLSGILPSSARVIWSRKGWFFGSAACMGLEFINPAQEAIAGLQQKISEKVERLESLERVKVVIGSILLITAVALLAFAIFQQSTIRNQMERSSHMLLTSSSSQAELYRESLASFRAQKLVLDEVVGDLDETKVLLSQAESFLAESKATNEQLSAEVARLKELNITLGKELTGAQEGLADAKEYINFAEGKIVYKGEIDSVDSARAAILAYRNRIREVKRQIRSLKKEAHVAKIAAQKERDRIALENGNRGFIIKDSKLFRPPTTASASSEKKVTVNVSFFE